MLSSINKEKKMRIFSKSLTKVPQFALQKLQHFNTTGKIGFNRSLKLVITIVFFSNETPSETMKNALYFIEKALLILKIFNF